MNSRRNPTWQEVGIPDVIVEDIRKLPNCNLLAYLVLNRVYRYHIKAQYGYICTNCDYRKNTSNVYEEYTVCEKCARPVKASPNWRMGKDLIDEISEDSIPRILKSMNSNYASYFNRYPEGDFFQGQWILDSISIPSEKPALGSAQDDDVPVKSNSSFEAYFSTGEKIIQRQQSLAIAKAAILCPFLWDDNFDWKNSTAKPKGCETHIIPLINMWTRLSRSGKIRDGMAYTKAPKLSEILEDN